MGRELTVRKRMYSSGKRRKRLSWKVAALSLVLVCAVVEHRDESLGEFAETKSEPASNRGGNGQGDKAGKKTATRIEGFNPSQQLRGNGRDRKDTSAKR